MLNVQNNFDDIFHVYVNTTTKEIDEIEKFEIINITDSKTVNFQVTFFEPYLYGLLNKKSDFLTVAIKDPMPLLLNSSGELMGANSTKLRIEMQFDFRSKAYIINLIIF